MKYTTENLFNIRLVTSKLNHKLNLRLYQIQINQELTIDSIGLPIYQFIQIKFKLYHNKMLLCTYRIATTRYISNPKCWVQCGESITLTLPIGMQKSNSFGCRG